MSIIDATLKGMKDVLGRQKKEVEKLKEIAEEEKEVRCLKCTYCGGTEFFEGPSGGLSVNVLCANKDCRHWFNHQTVFNKLEDLNRVEPTREVEQKEREERIKAQMSAPDRLYQEGVEHFMSGKSAKGLIKSKPDWHACTGEDFYKLAGFIDAVRKLSIVHDPMPHKKEQELAADDSV